MPPLNDLSDEQVQKLLGEVAPKVKELMEGVALAMDYYKEGGYDRGTWSRICDGLHHHERARLSQAHGAADASDPDRWSTTGRSRRSQSGPMVVM